MNFIYYFLNHRTYTFLRKLIKLRAEKKRHLSGDSAFFCALYMKVESASVLFDYYVVRRRD